MPTAQNRPRMKHVRTHRCQGFTLIEVLIATLLFAIAAQGLVTTVVNALTAVNSFQKDANRDTEERFILRELMQISGKDQLEEGGEIELPDGSTVNWSAEHEPTEVVDLHKLTFELDKNSRTFSNTENTTLTLYLLRPWLSEETDRTRLLDELELELERKEFRNR